MPFLPRPPPHNQVQRTNRGLFLVEKQGSPCGVGFGRCRKGVSRAGVWGPGVRGVNRPSGAVEWRP